MRIRNTYQQVLGVATPMLEGEILYREGKVDEGLAKLRAAVQAEDALRVHEIKVGFEDLLYFGADYCSITATI